MGKKGEARYRLVAAEKRSRRDGRPIELLGWIKKTTKGIEKEINRQRYDYWISQGARPSNTVENLIKQ